MPPRDKLQSGTVHGVELPKEDQCFAKSLGVRGGNVRKLAPSNMCVPKNVSLESCHLAVEEHSHLSTNSRRMAAKAANCESM